MTECKTLRLEFGDGFPANEYRLNGSCVEFRVVRPILPENEGWRRLTRSEILLHFELHTVVARWLSQAWEGMNLSVAAAVGHSPRGPRN